VSSTSIWSPCGIWIWQVSSGLAAHPFEVRPRPLAQLEARVQAHAQDAKNGIDRDLQASRELCRAIGPGVLCHELEDVQGAVHSGRRVFPFLSIVDSTAQLQHPERR
jgi:hypothetical protein